MASRVQSRGLKRLKNSVSNGGFQARWPGNAYGSSLLAPVPFNRLFTTIPGPASPDQTPARRNQKLRPRLQSPPTNI